MDHVYMTQCSLIRTYHQMSTAKADAVVSSEEPYLPKWLKGLVKSPSRNIQKTEDGTSSMAE